MGGDWDYSRLRARVEEPGEQLRVRPKDENKEEKDEVAVVVDVSTLNCDPHYGLYYGVRTQTMLQLMQNMTRCCCCC